jgi:hypothetical protein
MNPGIEEIQARSLRVLLAEAVRDQPGALDGDDLEVLADGILEMAVHLAGDHDNKAAQGFLRSLYGAASRW